MVKFEKIVSALINVSNIADENRKYDIKAKVWIDPHFSNTLENGIICDKDEENNLATFYLVGDNNLNINFYCFEDRHQEVLNEVNNFINECKDLKGLESLEYSHKNNE